MTIKLDGEKFKFNRGRPCGVCEQPNVFSQVVNIAVGRTLRDGKTHVILLNGGDQAVKITLEKVDGV